MAVNHGLVSTHSRLKAAGYIAKHIDSRLPVSTHSRLKAAGLKICREWMEGQGFNTQPPEGGWVLPQRRCACWCRFNTQPPEGGWQSVQQSRDA